jgi:hypothetical protein
MKVELIKKHQIAVQRMGGLYMGRTWEYDLYSAFYKDIITVGKTASEAINNCISLL